MEFIDYYKILEIDKNAGADDIKKAYRKLARKFHPDLNPTDKEAHKKFQQINEANEVLSDPEKRKKYDQYGKDWQHAEHFEKQQQPRQEHYRAEDFSGEGDFSSFFESMFGGGQGQRRTKFRGQDFNAELHLQLKDTLTTHQQTLAVNGKNIRITIPAGIENGQVIKLKGYGAPGVNGGPPGDLYTAVLGGDVVVETLSGKVKMKVNPETQPGTRVRLKGKGVPVYKQEGKSGDLYITYEVTLPTNLTEKQKDLFTELSKLK